MADEITVSVQLEASKGGAEESYKPQAFTFDQATKGVFKGTIPVATSETTISFTGLTSPCTLLMYNLDATNYVDWGLDNTTMQAIGRLYPYGTSFPSIITLKPGVTLKMQANTGACDVFIIALEL